MNRNDLLTLILVLAVTLTAGTAVYLGKPAPNPDTLALFQTKGMTCSNCSQKVNTALAQQSGVANVAIDLPTGVIEVYFDAQRTTPFALANRVSGLGFPTIVTYVQPYKSLPATSSFARPMARNALTGQ